MCVELDRNAVGIVENDRHQRLHSFRGQQSSGIFQAEAVGLQRCRLARSLGEIFIAVFRRDGINQIQNDFHPDRMGGGLYSNVLTLPAITGSGVLVICWETSRTRSQGSSLSSRTVFFRCEQEISSMPSNPASSIRLAMGSIMPVVIFSAQRL